jgi:hypothetical protein
MAVFKDTPQYCCLQGTLKLSFKLEERDPDGSVSSQVLGRAGARPS